MDFRIADVVLSTHGDMGAIDPALMNAQHVALLNAQGFPGPVNRTYPFSDFDIRAIFEQKDVHALYDAPRCLLDGHGCVLLSLEDKKDAEEQLLLSASFCVVVTLK